MGNVILLRCYFNNSKKLFVVSIENSDGDYCFDTLEQFTFRNFIYVPTDEVFAKILDRLNYTDLFFIQGPFENTLGKSIKGIRSFSSYYI